MVQNKEYNSVLVISGASGSGKSTIVKYLLETHPDIFELSVSFTTRAPRPMEENGKDYHFISKQEFREKIERGDFLEYTEYVGNYYGTDKIYAKPSNPNKILILEVNSNGVEAAKKNNLPAKYMYISVPVDELKKRISSRSNITDKELEMRLKSAEGEACYGGSGAFDVRIYNIDLNKTFEDVTAFIKSHFNQLKSK